MRKQILINLFLLSISTTLYSQYKTEDFKINLSENKFQNSLYSSIEYLDTRDDTTNLGVLFLDHGLSDRRRTIVANPSIATQLGALLNSLIDSTAKQGALLFQMRKFSFIQTVGGTYSKRYCNIRAQIYSKTNDVYRKIAFIDTIIITKSYNATRKMLKDASLVFHIIISENLLKEPVDSNYYGFADLLRLDSIEKSRILVYNTAAYLDGLYSTYKAFMNQTPDKKVTAKIDGNEMNSVRIFDENEKPVKVNSKEVYAIVYNGQPFISTPYGYFKLKKVNNDLIFTGKAKASADSEDVMLATLAFGVVGGILASNVTGTFEMKIDYIDGKVIIVKQIKDNFFPKN